MKKMICALFTSILLILGVGKTFANVNDNMVNNECVEYTMRFVMPDPNTEYSMNLIFPDPNTEYTMRYFYPEGFDNPYLYLKSKKGTNYQYLTTKTE